MADPRPRDQVAEALGDDPSWALPARGKCKTTLSRGLRHLTPWPAPLEPDAFHGLAGDIVRAIEPHTEADPAALLGQLLVEFGSVVGAGPYFAVEDDRHRMNEFRVLIGPTSKARKGTSEGRVRRFVGAADPQWAETRVLGGLSSGEGLIWSVRDPIAEREAVKERGRVVDYQDVVTDAGVEDKRLLVIEPEFAKVLRVSEREGSTLSPVLRQAWDTGDLRIMTKKDPARSTGAHVSVIGHITQDELLRYLTTTEAANGFGNRFLWVCARRSKSLPEGGRLDDATVAPLVHRLQDAIADARVAGELRRDDEARANWHQVYPALSEGGSGLLGAITSRAEAHVLRLSCLYTLLDRSATVRLEHLRAALAVWEYCEASARYLFGESLGDPLADEVCRALVASPVGLTRTEIRDLFGRNRGADEIERVLALLQAHGRARPTSDQTGGRPAERWVAPSVVSVVSVVPSGGPL